MRWSKRKVAGYGYLVENVGIGQSDKLEGVGAHAKPCTLDHGTGNDGVRNPGRRARGHRNPGDNGFPSAPPRAVERHRRWHQRLVGGLVDRKGQATVEFAVIAAGFLAVTVALMAFWRMLGDGLIVEHALAVASHHIQAVAPVTIADIFLY